MNANVVRQSSSASRAVPTATGSSSLFWGAVVSFAATTIVGGMFAISESSLAIFAAFALFAAVGLAIAYSQGAASSRLFLVVYAVSTLAAVALYFVYLGRFGAPYYFGGSDDLAYELWGRDTAVRLSPFAYGSIRGTVVPPWHNSVGYVYLVSLLYRLGDLFGGFHTMIPRYFNGMILGLVAVFTYRLALCVRLDRGLALTAALATGLLPLMVYNSIHTFRDILVAFLLLLVVTVWTTGMDEVNGRTSHWPWVLTIVVMLVMLELRRFQVAAIVAVVAARVFVQIRWRHRWQWLMGYFLLLLAIGVLLLFREQIWQIVGQLEGSQAGYTEYRLDRSNGLAAYVFNTPAPLGYLLRFAYTLISPIPIITNEIERLWLSVGTIIQYAFIPFLMLGIVQALRNKAYWMMLSAFVVLFTGMSLVTFTDRHILQFLPYATILAALGYQRHRKQRLTIWLAMAWLGACLAILYLYLKS